VPRLDAGFEIGGGGGLGLSLGAGAIVAIGFIVLVSAMG
jgi:hypothetical protein